MKIIVFLFIMIAGLTSCSRDESEIIPPKPIPDLVHTGSRIPNNTGTSTQENTRGSDEIETEIVIESGWLMMTKSGNTIQDTSLQSIDTLLEK